MLQKPLSDRMQGGLLPADAASVRPLRMHLMHLQAQLINGQGYYGDCVIPGGLGDVAGSAPYPANCSVTDYFIPSGELL